MRPLKELYQILYDSIKDDTHIGSLCNRIRYLHGINGPEERLMLKHFRWQKPRSMFFNLIGVNKKFAIEEHYIGERYWWDNRFSERSTQSRKNFIKHLIDKL